jgi:hypothetical protein
MSKKDDFKSLVNSINMVKNMVESIVAAVQDRFKDYDNVVVSLKDRIDKLEAQQGQGVTGQAIPADASASLAKLEQLEKRLDSLNERILLIEATRSVEGEAVEPTDVQAIKDLAEKETAEVASVPEVLPEPTPAPVPEPTQDITSVPTPPTADSIPTPITPAPAAPPPEPKAVTPPPEPQAQPTAEIPTAPLAPKPATQVTDTGERDVSPISKEVTGSIPMPPTKGDTITTDQPQPQVLKTDDATVPEEGKSAEMFGEAVSGDKAELLKALKKLEDL